MRWADFDRLLLGDGRRDRYTAAQVAAAVDDDQDRAAVLTPRVRTDVLKSRDE
jgi:hypothetical protein